MSFKPFLLSKARLEAIDRAYRGKVMVLSCAEISLSDSAVVGSKNASLGEMFNSLSAKGVRVPDGFATTTDAFRYFLEINDLERRIDKALNHASLGDISSVSRASKRIRHWILDGEFPPFLVEQVQKGYERLESIYGENTDVAVRGSPALREYPVAEALSQRDTLLNVRGTEAILDGVRRVFASLYSPASIIHRANLGMNPAHAHVSVGIQKMVRSDLSSSGVMSTLEPETGFRDVIYIASAYGLGESISSGLVNPDEFYVFKPDLKNNENPIIRRRLGDKRYRQEYTEDRSLESSTCLAEVPHMERARFSIDDDDVLELACFAQVIEDHYSQLVGRPMPMEIEWAKDGETGDLFVVQARPELIQSRKRPTSTDVYELEEPGWMLCSGIPVGNGIVHGKARVINDPASAKRLKEGEILITDSTDDRWAGVLHKAAAIITCSGGRAGHAAKMARELNIPAIVGASNARRVVRTGMDITVCCADREEGQVYEGHLRYSHHGVDFSSFAQPETQMMLSMANPCRAFEYSQLPVSGVGLAQLEFIILHDIGIHPKAFLQVGRVDTELQHEIGILCAGYSSARDYYIQRLMEGIGTVAAAFHPRPVTVRFSDFKSDEYAAMRGGEYFEPHEENPLIGLRGASRFFSGDFSEIFELECEAIRRVREEMGLVNTRLMVPFVRTLEESAQVLKLMERYGLKRGEKGLEVFMMCETPANAVLATEFLEDYDGFMIGMDDLFQLTLGVDTRSRTLKPYDKKNLAVLKLMFLAIEACKSQGKHIGVVGQAPSKHEEITSWLVAQGVDSITFQPTCYTRMLEIVLRSEHTLRRKRETAAEH